MHDANNESYVQVLYDYTVDVWSWISGNIGAARMVDAGKDEAEQ